MDITIDNLVVSKLSEFDINKVKNCASDVKTRSGSGRNQAFLARIRIWAEPRFFLLQIPDLHVGRTELFLLGSGSGLNRVFSARIRIWAKSRFFCSDPDLGGTQLFLLGYGTVLVNTQYVIKNIFIFKFQTKTMQYLFVKLSELKKPDPQWHCV